TSRRQGGRRRLSRGYRGRLRRIAAARSRPPRQTSSSSDTASGQLSSTAITTRFHSHLPAGPTLSEAWDEAPELPVLPSFCRRMRSLPCAWWPGVSALPPRAVDGSAERLRRTWSDGTLTAALPLRRSPPLAWNHSELRPYC